MPLRRCAAGQAASQAPSALQTGAQNASRGKRNHFSQHSPHRCCICHGPWKRALSESKRQTPQHGLRCLSFPGSPCPVADRSRPPNTYRTWAARPRTLLAMCSRAWDAARRNLLEVLEWLRFLSVVSRSGRGGVVEPALYCDAKTQQS